MTLLDWMTGRKGTLISIAVGTASWIAVFAAALAVWPAGPQLASAGDRIGYAAQCLAGVAVLVALMVAMCFRLFDTKSAESDPFAGGESTAWKIHQRVLQNTIEQALIFIPAMLALAARIPETQTRALPMLTALWCAGRLLFWIGYRIKPVFRGPGFEWTLFSSLAALVWFASTL